MIWSSKYWIFLSDMASIFTKIINQEIPGYIVAEDENHLAFLDINPLAEGHTLVVPKLEVDYIYDLEDDTLAQLHVFAKRVAKAIESVVTCERIGVTVIGLEVPHAHIHLIPINSITDMSFSKPKLSFSQMQFESIASKIRAAFAG